MNADTEFEHKSRQIITRIKAVLIGLKKEYDSSFGPLAAAAGTSPGPEFELEAADFKVSACLSLRFFEAVSFPLSSASS